MRCHSRELPHPQKCFLHNSQQCERTISPSSYITRPDEMIGWPACQFIYLPVHCEWLDSFTMLGRPIAITIEWVSWVEGEGAGLCREAWTERCEFFRLDTFSLCLDWTSLSLIQLTNLRFVWFVLFDNSYFYIFRESQVELREHIDNLASGEKHFECSRSHGEESCLKLTFMSKKANFCDCGSLMVIIYNIMPPI